MTESEFPKKFKPFDWIVLITATVLGAFVIPHITANIYLVSTTIVAAGPEPIIIIGGLFFLAIMSIIVWRKMIKLQKASSKQIYQKTIWALSSLVVVVVGLLFLRIF